MRLVFLLNSYYLILLFIVFDLIFHSDHLVEIYSTYQEKFENMKCFQEYKSYTNSNIVPKFCRELSEITE